MFDHHGIMQQDPHLLDVEQFPKSWLALTANAVYQESMDSTLRQCKVIERYLECWQTIQSTFGLGSEG